MDKHPMKGLTFLRRLPKVFHPEGIPWPGSAIYNRISATDVFQEHYDRVAQHILTYCSTGRLLDVGTGPGRLLIALHKASPHMRLTGIDISSAMVGRARKNMEAQGLRRDIPIRGGSASMIPFPDNTFDIVISTAAIHHWKDPVKALNEVYRVLKSGRHALIYDVVSGTPSHIVEQMQRRFGRLRTAFFWIHAYEEPFLSLSSFQRLAEDTLFKKGEIRFVGVLCCLILKKEIPDIVA
jgi:ubiquinone/menaquinone biosynthesis C-methylase UbiE